MIALWLALGLFDGGEAPEVPAEPIGSGGTISSNPAQEWEAQRKRPTLDALVAFDDAPAPKPAKAPKPAPEAPQAAPAPVAVSLLPAVAEAPETLPALVLEASPDYTEAALAMLAGQLAAQQAQQARQMAEELEMVGVLLAMLEAA